MDPTTLVSGKNAMLAGAILVVIATARQLVPGLFVKRWMQRILPLLPIFLALIAMFLGFGDAGSAAHPVWQDQVVAGLLTGAAAATAFKIGRTTVLGQGLDDVPSGAPPAPPAVAAASVSPSVGGGG